ncbi:RNA pseudouridylate synthase, partial [Rhizoctonia solani]
MARNLVAFMDRGLIVLNKPAGLVSQGGKHTLVHRPLVRQKQPATTGAFILARNTQVAQTLSSQLRRPSSNAIIKTYLALVHGSFEPESNGEIRKSLFISDGRVSVQPSSIGAISKEVPTHTTWRCLFSEKGVSLVELGLKTGVKHQLRVTMAQILNGDQVYGSPKSRNEQLMLHSARVEILRYLLKPVLGRRTYKLGIVVPPPSGFLSICQSLGFSIDHPWAPSPVRVTVDGSEIPYDPSYTLDEEIVTEALLMKDFEAKSLSSRILSATRSTGSAITRSIPLPGLSEVKGAAKKLVDGLETIDDHAAKCKTLTSRIASISSMLENHFQEGEDVTELSYLYTKLQTCQRQLSRIDSRRGLSGALRATRQIEVIERVEKEIGTGLQDFLFSIMLRRLSTPRQNLTIKPDETTSKNHVGTMVRRRRIDSVVKSVTRGTYRNRNILLVQYSSKKEPQKAAEMFLASVKTIIQEQHPNVLHFMGGSEDSGSYENHYMMFDVGTVISREAFVQSLRSAQKAFSFLEGVKAGMKFLLDYGVQTWDDIHISHDGRAVLCPPYWDDPDTWSKSNHDVFTSLTGTTHSPDFPLTTLTEILNMAGSRWSDFQLTVTTHGYGLRDYHLMQIADELELPVPPFLLIYCGPLPDFLVSVGSIGVPEWIITGRSSDCFSGSMTDWVGISSLWSCTGWEVLQTCTLEYWSVGNGPPYANEDHEDFSCGATLEPLGSPDGWLSYGCFESSDSFGISYELAVSDPVLFEESWKRYSATKISNIMHMAEDEQSIQAVRHISVNIRCKLPKKRGLLPLYFHRRPSSLFNVEHYWGFLSDSPDPDVPPCRLVRDVQVEYSVEINTLRANDTWAFRAEQCFESIVSRTPGSFHAW